MTARLGFGLITAAVLAASAPAAPAAEPGAVTPLAMRAALPARTAVADAEAVQLQFQARPAWQQRLEQISRKGLPLLNLRRLLADVAPAAETALCFRVQRERCRQQADQQPDKNLAHVFLPTEVKSFHRRAARRCPLSG